MRRILKAEFILLDNIRTLMATRNIDAKTLAFAVGHSQAWLSKILSGDRHMSLTDMGKIAEFFGLTASELICHGIGPLTERRRSERRRGDDRRSGVDRRQQDRPFMPKGMPLRSPDDENVA